MQGASQTSRFSRKVAELALPKISHLHEAEAWISNTTEPGIQPAALKSFLNHIFVIWTLQTTFFEMNLL